MTGARVYAVGGVEAPGARGLLYRAHPAQRSRERYYLTTSTVCVILLSVYGGKHFMARPRVKFPKGKLIQARLCEADYRAVAKAADAEHLSLSEFCRIAVMRTVKVLKIESEYKKAS